MHTVETDGKNTIEEMAEAAADAWLQVHGHHRPLQEPRLRQRPGRQARRRTHQADSRPRTTDRRITILAGIEVDILADGALDLSDSVLAQMDIVIASVHSALQPEAEQR